MTTYHLDISSSTVLAVCEQCGWRALMFVAANGLTFAAASDARDAAEAHIAAVHTGEVAVRMRNARQQRHRRQAEQ